MYIKLQNVMPMSHWPLIKETLQHAMISPSTQDSDEIILPQSVCLYESRQVSELDMYSNRQK